MNRKIVAVSLVVSFVAIALAANFAVAQVPAVPEPTCVSVPEAGLTCPGDAVKKGTKAVVPEKAESASPTYRFLDDFTAEMNKLIDGLKKGLKDVFEDLALYFDGVTKKLKKTPPPAEQPEGKK